jgi:hypothetical protein
MLTLLAIVVPGLLSRPLKANPERGRHRASVVVAMGEEIRRPDRTSLLMSD